MKVQSHALFDKHMVRAAKSLLRNLFLTFGVLLTGLVILRIVSAVYSSQISAVAAEHFYSGIAQDLSYLKTQGDALAENQDLQRYLVEGDYESLLSFLQQEKAARSIGLMGVANADGAIVTRTKSVTKHGDNVFLTAPVGRVVAQNKSAQSVELTGFGPQLFLTTGRPILEQGQMVGGLFANYLTDDDYATRFKENYLPPGVEIAFYTNQYGIYGNSFSDPVVDQRLDSYFNSSSEWINGELNEKTIFFEDGQYFLVKNEVFPGLEDSPGGVLLFIPRQDISTVANVIIGLTTAFTFLMLSLYFHLRARGEEKTWRYYLLLLVTSVVVAAMVYFTLKLQDNEFIGLSKEFYVADHLTLSLNPEFGIFDQEAEQRFSVIASGQLKEASQLDVSLLYDQTALQIKELDDTSTACSSVLQKQINEQEGRITFTCILSPSAQHSERTLTDIILQPIASGQASLEFDNSTTHLSDLTGSTNTDILRMTQSSSYRFEDFNYAAVGQRSDLLAPKPLVVFSPTHPNASRWYSTRTARFVWASYSEQGFVYAFDNKPDTVPLYTHIVTDSHVEIPVPGDGVYYFHLKSLESDHVEHYRIQVDHTPPTITSLAVSSNYISVGGVLRLTVQADDAASGIQNNYYIAVDQDLWLPVGEQVLVPMTKAGTQHLAVRAFDTAGNFTEQSLNIEVKTAQ